MSITAAPVNTDTAQLVHEPAADPSVGHSEDSYDAQIEALIEQSTKKDGDRAKEPKGLKPGESWDSVLAAAPPDVQRAMAQMRADYTKKTQELARQRKEIESQQAALLASPVYTRLAEAATQEGLEYDPFNEESMETLIERKVAQRLQSLLEPLHEQQKQTVAQERYASFLEANPDLQSDPAVRGEVRAALEADPNLSLENAYYAVKGRGAVARSKAEAERAATLRKAAQSAALKTSSGVKAGSPIVSESLRTKSAWEIYSELAKAKG